MPYITHPTGQKTFYRDDCFADPWRPTETIMIQHGFGRSSAFWYQWVPILATKYRVIRRDALGHGYSSPPPKGHPVTFDAVLGEMIDTLDQLGIKKVHLLCESTGGIFGDFAAAKYPDRMHSVTICGSPLVLPPAAQKLLAYGYDTCPESVIALGARGWGKKFIETSKTDEGAPEGYMDWWLDQFSIPSADGLAAYASVVCSKDADAHLILDQIKAPMLLLTPANSVLVDIEDQKLLAKAANGQLELIHGHGHEIYLDQAEVCQQKFLEFIGRHGEKS